MHPKTDGILKPTRGDEEKQRNGEQDGQDEHRNVGKQQERLPEHHGRDDIVKDNGVADKHFQRGQRGNQEQLNPVAVRHGMG